MDRRFLRNLLRIRGLEQWTRDEQRRLVMLQYSTLLAVFNMAVFLGLYLLLGSATFVAPLTATAACVPLYLLSWFLNRNGRPLTAKLLFCTLLSGSIFLSTVWFFGKAPGLHFFLLLAAVVPLLFWPLKRPGWVIVLMGGSLAGFLFVQLRSDESSVLIRDFPVDLLPFFNVFSVVGVFFVTVVILALFQRRSEADALGLEEKARQLESLLNTIPDLVWLKDSEGIYQICNRKVEALFGAGEGGVLGRKDSDFIGPELAGYFRQSDLAALGADRPIRSEHEMTFRSDGHREFIETVKSAVRGDDGRLLGVLGVGRDTTEKRRITHTLEVNEERLRLAMEGLHDAVWDLDLQTGQFYRSPSWWTMLGYPPTEEVGYTGDVVALVHPEDQALVTKETRRAVEQNGAYRVEARIRKADGSWLWVEIRGSVSAVDGSGKAVRLSGMNSDIGGRKAAEQEKEGLLARLQQAQKMESLGKLASGVAHDMNNVLGAVLSLVSGLQLARNLDGPTALSLGEIAKAVKRGGGMVRSLLDFARETPLVMEVFGVNELLAEELAFLEKTILAKARFDLDLAGDLKPIRGDRTALKNLIMNLCVNSADAMAESGVVSVRTRNCGEGAVEIRVADNGCGMTPEVLARALDPFFTTKPVGKGTGLGLSMAYAAVKNHGGRFDIESAPGKGTTVWITLPAASEQVPKPDHEPVPPVLPTGPLSRNLRILLVDDDAALLEASEELLTLLGNTVVTADRAERAFEVLGEGTPVDLVVLDMTMPGMGGFQALPLLKERYPELPVIVATGLADDRAEALVRRFPRVALLPKPYDAADLRSLLEGLVNYH